MYRSLREDRSGDMSDRSAEGTLNIITSLSDSCRAGLNDELGCILVALAGG